MILHDFNSFLNENNKFYGLSIETDLIDIGLDSEEAYDLEPFIGDYDLNSRELSQIRIGEHYTSTVTKEDGYYYCGLYRTDDLKKVPLIILLNSVEHSIFLENIIEIEEIGEYNYRVSSKYGSGVINDPNQLMLFVILADMATSPHTDIESEILIQCLEGNEDLLSFPIFEEILKIILDELYYYSQDHIDILKCVYIIENILSKNEIHNESKIEKEDFPKIAYDIPNKALSLLRKEVNAKWLNTWFTIKYDDGYYYTKHFSRYNVFTNFNELRDYVILSKWIDWVSENLNQVISLDSLSKIPRLWNPSEVWLKREKNMKKAIEVIKKTKLDLSFDDNRLIENSIKYNIKEIIKLLIDIPTVREKLPESVKEFCDKIKKENPTL